MLTSCFLKRDGAAPPLDGSAALVVAENGVFGLVDQPLYRAVVPLREELQPQYPELTLRLPKLGAGVLAQGLGFLTDVMQRTRGGEGVLLITLGEEGVTTLEAPPQRIPLCPCCRLPYPLVSFDEEAIPGRRRLGTMHSHAGEGPPVFSETDEMSSDGLDIVVVGLGKSKPIFGVALRVRGHAFRLSISDVAEGPYLAAPYPAAWIEERVQTVIMPIQEASDLAQPYS